MFALMEALTVTIHNLQLLLSVVVIAAFILAPVLAYKWFLFTSARKRKRKHIFYITRHISMPGFWQYVCSCGYDKFEKKEPEKLRCPLDFT